jgi:hypothetical protein
MPGPGDASLLLPAAEAYNAGTSGTPVGRLTDRQEDRRSFPSSDPGQ